MTLRRFPWKAPRLSDNSYKLFVTEPTEEERRLPGYPQVIHSEPASRQPSEANDDNSSTKGHRHHRGKSHDESAKSEPGTRNNGVESSSTSVVSSATSTISTSQPQPQVIKGPWRLLRLLPRETRHIIGRMLEVDPRKRTTLDEIHKDPWVQRTPTCRQEEGGRVIQAEGHTHTLEPSNGQSAPAESKKK
jgi:serine/threonine protein kinase